MLRVNKLSKAIKQKTILKEISFEIGRGELALFVGESGAGKSTLLRVLNGLESYESGSILWDGTVGMVFQHFNLFEHFNAEENIIRTLIHCKNMGKEEARERANQLLLRYGLQQRAKASVQSLSGGERQRLAIARTLAVDPGVICLDEPTSALDPRLTAQVAQFIVDLVEEGRTVLLTSHDTSLLRQLDGRLFLMDAGSIVEQGLKSEWISDPASYPRLHRFLNGHG